MAKGVLSIRIDEALLAEVRAQASRDGRSVSGEIVHVLRGALRPGPSRPAPKRLTGWLARSARPADSLEAMRQGRERASAALSRAVKRRARRA